MYVLVVLTFPSTSHLEIKDSECPRKKVLFWSHLKGKSYRTGDIFPHLPKQNVRAIVEGFTQNATGFHYVLKLKV